MKKNQIEHKKVRRKRWIDISGGIISVVMLVILFNPFNMRNEQMDAQKRKNINAQERILEYSDLEQILNQNISEYTGEWSVFVKNFDENAIAAVNPRQMSSERILNLCVNSIFFQTSENSQIERIKTKNNDIYIKSMNTEQDIESVVIFSSDGTYAIFVMSKNEDDKSITQKEIENISQCVYTYFNR